MHKEMSAEVNTAPRMVSPVPERQHLAESIPQLVLIQGFSILHDSATDTAGFSGFSLRGNRMHDFSSRMLEGSKIRRR